MVQGNYDYNVAVTASWDARLVKLRHHDDPPKKVMET